MGIGNGWTDSPLVNIANGQLLFNEEEILVNEKTYTVSSNPLVVEATFLYNDVDMGLILWYNNVGYIKYALSSEGLSVTRYYEENELRLKDFLFKSNENIPVPQAEDTIILRAELHRTNIKCYLNEQIIFNLEQNAFSEGSFGICGGPGTKCARFDMKSNGIQSWSRNLKEGCLCIKDKDGIRFSNATSLFSYISQEVSVKAGDPYTVSVPYRGNLYIEIYDGTNVIATGEDNSTDMSRLTLSFVSTSNSLEVRIGTVTIGETIVYMPQIENKDFGTSTTEDSRNRSILSFPASKMDRYAGGISFVIRPLHKYEAGLLPVFYYNDSFNLVYTDGNFVMTYGTETLSLPCSLETDNYYKIIATWSNTDCISLHADGMAESLIIGSQDIPQSDILLIGCTPDTSANVAMNMLLVYAGETSIEDMSGYTMEDAKANNRFVIKTVFAMHALDFSENKITVPNPKPMTPIFIEDEQGTPYERVYFLDDGQYVVYNKETKEYTGNKTFTVDYDNLFSARAYNDTRIYNDVVVDGNLITVNDLSLDDHVVESEILTTVDNRTYRSINKNWIKAPVVVTQPTLDGGFSVIDPSMYVVDYKDGMIIFRQTLTTRYDVSASYSYTTTPEVTIQYTPNNVFCASYSDQIGGYEILLSNTGGNSITITYENIYGAKEKLITSVESNPFKAANNNGFIYVISDPIPAISLDVTVTPSALVADGNQIATITVTCLGEKDIPTNNASIAVKLQHGTRYGYIEKYVSDEEQAWLDAFAAEAAVNGKEAAITKYGHLVTDEHHSGRFIYKFHVNNIVTGDKLTERIIVTDTKSGIGTEVPITITPRR